MIPRGLFFQRERYPADGDSWFWRCIGDSKCSHRLSSPSIQEQGCSDPESACNDELAPKKTISIPKLEQNAALQVGRLMNAVEGALTRKAHRRYLGGTAER